MTQETNKGNANLPQEGKAGEVRVTADVLKIIRVELVENVSDYCATHGSVLDVGHFKAKRSNEGNSAFFDRSGVRRKSDIILLNRFWKSLRS